MPNIAGVLKEEIRRLAKKEIKAQVGKTQKAAAQSRRDIAHLKRLLGQQEREIKLLKKQQGQPQSRRRAVGERSLFSPLGQRPTTTPRAIGCGLWQTGRRIGIDHLQLGTRKVPSSQGPTCRPGCRSWHWQEGSVVEIGGIGGGEEETTTKAEVIRCRLKITSPIKCGGVRR